MKVKDILKVNIEGKELEVEKGTPLGEVFKKVGIEDALGGKLTEGSLIFRHLSRKVVR